MAHAIHIYEQGGPDVLLYEPIEIEKPKVGQVRRRQTAIGVNFLDTYFRKGDFPLPSSPFINGFEAAGVIEEVGEGVTDFVWLGVGAGGALGCASLEQQVPGVGESQFGALHKHPRTVIGIGASSL